MKNIIHTLQEALAYQLKGLIYAETKVRDEFEICSHQITSPELKAEIQRYVGNRNYKLQKLDRIFNYLMQEPGLRKNEVIARMIEETHYLVSLTSSGHLRDILMVGCIQNINAYKIASYKTVYLYTLELELDTAADLAQQILEWELETSKTLSALSIHEFNKVNSAEKTN
jgi:ferritin-like metal-binding protein YciE